MPVDQLERTKGLAANANRLRQRDRFVMYVEGNEVPQEGYSTDRFVVYPETPKEAPPRSSKPDFLRRKLARSRVRAFPPRLVRQIQVGRTVYMLKASVIGCFQKGVKGVAFRVDDLLPHFVGEGGTADEAYKEWCEHIHVFIQRMRVIPPSLRSADECKQWAMASAYIDLDRYDRTQPIKSCRRGRVVSSWPDPWKVTWSDGSEEEISLDIMPDEFGAFETGDAFEATLDQDAVSGKTLYVFSVRPLVLDESPSEDEEAEFWRSVTQTEDLPESDRDWTR
jgi:hypothetical protein